MGLNSAGVCCVTTMAGEGQSRGVSSRIWKLWYDDELLGVYTGAFYMHWNVTNDASNEQASTGRRFVRCSSMGAVLQKFARQFVSLSDHPRRVNIVDFFVIRCAKRGRVCLGRAA